MASRQYMISNGRAGRIAGGADLADFRLLRIYIAEPVFQIIIEGKKKMKKFENNN